MRAQDPHDRNGRRPWRRRRFRPACENLESRALLTTLAPNLPGKHFPAPNVQQFVPFLYPPGTPQPTAAEVKRESFVAKGVGRYTIGPGQFDTQTITIHGFGKPMTSNISRKMHFQFVVFEPTDPTQAVDGTINLVGGNYLQNSTDLILYLVGPTSSEVNGLPTSLYFTTDANSPSSTAFAETGERFPRSRISRRTTSPSSGNLAPPPGSPGSLGPPTSVDNWGMALGDATFKYIPDKHPSPGSLGSGTVIVELTGLRNYSGAQSQFDQAVQLTDNGGSLILGTGEGPAGYSRDRRRDGRERRRESTTGCACRRCASGGAFVSRLTAEGRGAIAVLRVWGPRAIEVADAVFRPHRGVAAGRDPSRTVAARPDRPRAGRRGGRRRARGRAPGRRGPVPRRGRGHRLGRRSPPGSRSHDR